MKLRHPKTIIILAVMVAVVVLSTIGVLLYSRNDYSSTRLTLLCHDADGNQRSITASVTRTQTAPRLYDFSYTIVALSNNTQPRTFASTYQSFNPQLKTDKIILRYIDNNNENTIQENFSASFNLDNEKIDVNMADMHSDFLINNSLDRLTYINLGQADVHINGVAAACDFAFNKTQSRNLNLLAGSPNGSRGVAAFFVDSAGTLYYSDTSEVPQNNTNYVSHSWIISKWESILTKDTGEDVAGYQKGKSFGFRAPNIGISDVLLNHVSSTSLGGLDYRLLKGPLTDQNGASDAIGSSLSYGY